jgi:hypothetical protein
MKFEDVYLEIIDDIPEKDDKRIIANLQPLALEFETRLHHTTARSLFITKSGVTGPGPYGTHNGDALVSLRGASFTSVLRAGDKEIDGTEDGKG